MKHQNLIKVMDKIGPPATTISFIAFFFSPSWWWIVLLLFGVINIVAVDRYKKRIEKAEYLEFSLKMNKVLNAMYDAIPEKYKK